MYIIFKLEITSSSKFEKNILRVRCGGDTVQKKTVSPIYKWSPPPQGSEFKWSPDHRDEKSSEVPRLPQGGMVDAKIECHIRWTNTTGFHPYASLEKIYRFCRSFFKLYITMNQVNQSCFKVQMEINKYYLFRNKQLSSNFYPRNTKKNWATFLGWAWSLAGSTHLWAGVKWL